RRQAARRATGSRRHACELRRNGCPVKMWRRALFSSVLTALAACNESPFPDLDLERMIHQAKYLPYQSSELFADGKAMRSPPAGAVAHDRLSADPARNTGMIDGRYVEQVPMDATRTTMDRGHVRFDIFCAPCHGIAGDG